MYEAAEVAAALAGGLEDWSDFGIILTLLFLNAIIGFAEEHNAGSCVLIYLV